VFIGRNAGNNNDQGSKTDFQNNLIIDQSILSTGAARTTAAAIRENALLYGTFANATSGQQLTINARNITLNGNANVTGNITIGGNNICNNTVCFTLQQLNTTTIPTTYAQYQFTNNNFNGSGNFTTTGRGTFMDVNITNNINAVGNITGKLGIFTNLTSNGGIGATKTIQIGNASNTGNCSLIFVGGLYTGGSC
jgi:hypothetical protein